MVFNFCEGAFLLGVSQEGGQALARTLIQDSQKQNFLLPSLALVSLVTSPRLLNCPFRKEVINELFPRLASKSPVSLAPRLACRTEHPDVGGMLEFGKEWGYPKPGLLPNPGDIN